MTCWIIISLRWCPVMAVHKGYAFSIKWKNLLSPTPGVCSPFLALSVLIGAGHPLQHGEVRDSNLALLGPLSLTDQGTGRCAVVVMVALWLYSFGILPSACLLFVSFFLLSPPLPSIWNNKFTCFFPFYTSILLVTCNQFYIFALWCLIISNVYSKNKSCFLIMNLNLPIW